VFLGGILMRSSLFSGRFKTVCVVAVVCWPIFAGCEPRPVDPDVRFVDDPDPVVEEKREDPLSGIDGDLVTGQPARAAGYIKSGDEKKE